MSGIKECTRLWGGAATKAALLFFTLVLLCTGPEALCQGAVGSELDQSYSEYFGSGSSQGAAALVAGVRSALVSFLRIVLVLASMGALVLTVFNMMSGEQSGAKRFLLWGIGLALGFAVLTVLGSVRVSTAGGGSGFAGLQGAVADFFEILLCTVCMVTFVVVVVHVMNGERDGFQKMIRWLVLSGAGLCLLEAARTFL